MEWATTIDFAKAWVQARDITGAINHEGLPRPTFARAIQNMAATVVLLVPFPAPSTSGVYMVYHQLRDILGELLR
jgi:hypothetical protein